MFRLSTRLTLDTAASPTPDTIRVSAMPMLTLRNCSSSSGQISVTSWRRVNMGAFVSVIVPLSLHFQMRNICTNAHIIKRLQGKVKVSRTKGQKRPVTGQKVRGRGGFPSKVSKNCLVSDPQAKPPSRPPAATTRWQGTNSSTGLR